MSDRRRGARRDRPTAEPRSSRVRETARPAQEALSGRAPIQRFCIANELARACFVCACGLGPSPSGIDFVYWRCAPEEANARRQSRARPAQREQPDQRHRVGEHAPLPSINLSLSTQQAQSNHTHLTCLLEFESAQLVTSERLSPLPSSRLFPTWPVPSLAPSLSPTHNLNPLSHPTTTSDEPTTHYPRSRKLHDCSRAATLARRLIRVLTDSFSVRSCCECLGPSGGTPNHYTRRRS